MSTSIPNAEDVRLHFTRLAMQYYVAGRAAAIDQLIPVLGNLLHHAVEMSIKGALASSHSLSQLKGLGHNLPKLWQPFAATFPSMDSAKFQASVDTLHRFEELRYPDSLLSHGAMMQFVLHRSHLGATAPSAPGVPNYLLVLEDIDEFEEAIFKAMNLNPQFFTASLSPKAKEHLLLHNLHGADW